VRGRGPCRRRCEFGPPRGPPSCTVRLLVSPIRRPVPLRWVLDSGAWQLLTDLSASSKLPPETGQRRDIARRGSRASFRCAGRSLCRRNRPRAGRRPAHRGKTTSILKTVPPPARGPRFLTGFADGEPRQRATTRWRRQRKRRAALEKSLAGNSAPGYGSPPRHCPTTPRHAETTYERLQRGSHCSRPPIGTGFRQRRPQQAAPVSRHPHPRRGKKHPPQP